MNPAALLLGVQGLPFVSRLGLSRSPQIVPAEVEMLLPAVPRGRVPATKPHKKQPKPHKAPGQRVRNVFGGGAGC